MKRVYAIILVWILPWELICQKLPTTIYTVADGLASPFVNSVMCDSRGFVWFSTRSGISRFDGEHFVNYGQEDGLTDAAVHSVIEMNDGSYWVALTNGTSCRMRPSSHRFSTGQAPEEAKPLFEPFHLQVDSQSYDAGIVYRNSCNEVFVGGVEAFLIGNSSLHTFRPVRLPHRPGASVTCFAAGPDGSLWIGTFNGLFRYDSTGNLSHYQILRENGRDGIISLSVDLSGRLWIGHSTAGVFVIVPEAADRARGDTERSWRFRTFWIDEQTGRLDRVELPRTPSSGIRIAIRSRDANILTSTVLETEDGRFWIGTEKGILILDGQSLTLWNASKGYPSGVCHALSLDRAGNIWAATSNGAVRIEPAGLEKFTRSDGVEGEWVHSLYQDRTGRIVAVAGNWSLNYYLGDRFVSFRPRSYGKTLYEWASRVAFLDHHDDWWFLGAKGLWHFPRTRSLEEINAQNPTDIIDHSQGYDFRASFCMYEDKEGSLWISLRGFSPGQNGLLRIERSSGKLIPVTEAQGLPPSRSAVSFCEDSSHGLWFGFYQGGLAHLYQNTFRYYAEDRVIPPGMITSLLYDRFGKLWIGSSEHGLTCIDNPADTTFRSHRYTTKEGLASNNVRCLVDDPWGRIYAGTARGITQLDPKTGRVHHYTTGDGLPADFVTTAFRDTSNTLWFGTSYGLARMRPEPPTRDSEPLPVFISELEIGGVSRPLSPLGEQSLPLIELQPNENSIHIGFFSIRRKVGEVVRYQYRLQGGESSWSRPIQERNVHFENLSPGEYEFQVRAVSSIGNESRSPSTIPFTILAPVTSRWWFRTLVGAIVLALAYAAYRYRISTLLRLERLRLSIASDLHDEVGSALTKISIHSEIIQNATDAHKVNSSSRMIGSLSREVIRTFSDIVWSIDTRHDTYGELTARMKSFALDVLSSKDITVEFSFNGLDPSAKVPVELRQNLYLIFKESVNNVVRHSAATKVSIGLQKMDHTLRLSVHDNGHGIPPGRTDAGHGLKNMKMRAALLHGSIAIEHQNGCAITLTVKTV